MDKEKVASIFKALCDKNRLEIVELLQSGEKCACNIGEELNIAQSKLSYHMKILCESQIVETRQSGKWTYYRISNEGGKNAIKELENLLSTRVDQNTTCIDCCE